jgi:hypothetical protein
MSALVTVVAGGALRASDPVLTVAAVAAVVVLLTWYARLHADDGHPAFGLTNPAAAVTLTVVGRRPWSTLLPDLTAHTLGAVLGGLGAYALADSWGNPLIYDADDLVVAGVGGAVVGLLVAWTSLALDAGGPDALSAAPVVVAGGLLPLGLIGAFSPAVLVGLATANLIGWAVALVAAGSGLLASAVGAWLVGLLLPTEA